jgi:hypothetical protein
MFQNRKLSLKIKRATKSWGQRANEPPKEIAPSKEKGGAGTRRFVIRHAAGKKMTPVTNYRDLVKPKRWAIQRGRLSSAVDKIVFFIAAQTIWKSMCVSI